MNNQMQPLTSVFGVGMPWGQQKQPSFNMTDYAAPGSQRKPSTGLPPATGQRPATVKPATTTPAAAATTQYSAKNPPTGFTSAQWSQLLTLAKTNPQLASLMTQYTSNLGKGGVTQDPAWRRSMPTDTSQLLRQLSYNAGEMGMPGGYVGAVQLPAYGSGLAPVNNPDMTKYGQSPGIGEATFYQQSMKGGMAPIAAMSPLGVPQGWNPGGANTQQTLAAYLAKINAADGTSGGSGGTAFPDPSSYQYVKAMHDYTSGAKKGASSAANPNNTSDSLAALIASLGGSAGSTTTQAAQIPGATSGVPITLPYGA